MLSEFNAPRWRTWGEKIGEEYPIVQEWNGWLSERMTDCRNGWCFDTQNCRGALSK